MSISTSNFDTTWTNGVSKPTNAFPDGSAEFSKPKAISTTNLDTSWSVVAGVGAEGVIEEGGNFTAGKVRLLNEDGTVGNSKALARAGYSVGYIPSGIASGQSVTEDMKVEFLGENGGKSEKVITNRLTTFDVNFGSLTVTVSDVDGNAIGGVAVSVAGETSFTDSDGQISVPASDGAAISVLDGSVSDTLSISGGQSKTKSYTYAGLQGSMDSPGGPIKDAVVEVKDSNGDVIESTTTDEFGSYEFTRLPVSSSLEVVIGPFTRQVTTGNQGVKSLKNVPFGISLGAVDIECVSKADGGKVRKVDLELEGLKAKSGGDGAGSVIAEAPVDATVRVAKSDNRFVEVAEDVTISAGNSIFRRYELEEKYNPSGY